MENRKENGGVQVTSPVLPTGGGTVQGMGESMGAIGPDGMASFQIPLPVSSGRGYAPSLSLNYSSGAGSTPFGMGWDMSLPKIQRQTRKGVPVYNNDVDVFLGPNGEPLVKMEGNATENDTFQGVALGNTYSVTQYLPRVEGSFDKIEFWKGIEEAVSPFWLVFGADGQIHIYGKNEHAQIKNPADNTQIAEWLLEESVSPTGEHIEYLYIPEQPPELLSELVSDTTTKKSTGPTSPQRSELVSDPNKKNKTTNFPQRYLSKVLYGNKTAKHQLNALTQTQPNEDEYLFINVFDYGERANALTTQPTYSTTGVWDQRLDPYCNYEYGFEISSYRLCKQVILFHRMSELEVGTSEEPVFISGIQLTYDEDQFVTHLEQVQQVAYEPNGTALTVPPIDFKYERSRLVVLSSNWQKMEGYVGIDNGYDFQLVDLYGEGIPGILYRDQQGWQYQAAIRDENGAVTYDDPHTLSEIPTLRNGGMLMDINGDGKLDWLTTQYGATGYYSSNPDQSWNAFVPLKQTPLELAHPAAQFADIKGAGLSDLAMVDPEGVRWYANERDGFGNGNTVANEALPVFRPSEREVIVFADVLGSGQEHLVSITANGVKCFPNLGHGRFGNPIHMEGFELPTGIVFHPNRLFLADLDGSGAIDILYATSDNLLVYRNCAGNSFHRTLNIPFPKDVHFDDTCRLTIADMQGLGVSSLLLSIPHPTPQHYRLDLNEQKPYLLTTINNNRGLRYEYSYKSSVQYWLDDKQQADTTLASALPFPIHVVAETKSIDEITGNQLTQSISYHHGVYDGEEREFRGFGRVDTLDTNSNAVGTSEVTTPPALVKTWYHTGRAEDETKFKSEYFDGDTEAFEIGATLLSTWDGNKDDINTAIPPKEQYWFYRALNGQQLRSELYTSSELVSEPKKNIHKTNSTPQPKPITTTSSRYLVRQVQPQNNHPYPVVLPIAIEELNYQYDGIIEDPQCAQSILVASDEYGLPLSSVAINYPRRAQGVNPYPSSVLETTWSSSYDPQQEVLRITETHSSWFNLTQDEESWRLGLANESTQYVIHPGTTDFIQYEDTIDEQGPLSDSATRMFAGNQQMVYVDAASETPLTIPTILGLVGYTETVEFDETTLAVYDGVDDIEDKLEDGGYLKNTIKLVNGDQIEVWKAQKGFTKYAGIGDFYRPQEVWSSKLVGRTKLEYDTRTCVVTKSTDPLGNASELAYDYRFLSPCRSTDVNNNEHVVHFDALGRVEKTWFCGTENGSEVGFPDQGASDFEVPSSEEDAIDWVDNTEVAAFYVYNTEAWMQDKVPPHVISVTPDEYPGREQQLLKQVVYSDGFGRSLQVSQLAEGGKAYQLGTDGFIEDTSLVDTSDRWAVTGKTEYDNKGNPIRSYIPYYLNTWKYVKNDEVVEQYADTHYYDALGREVKVETAADTERRTQYYPWFTIAEDENDTQPLTPGT